jgi:hypothetical protein
LNQYYFLENENLKKSEIGIFEKFEIKIRKNFRENFKKIKNQNFGKIIFLKNKNIITN